MTLKAESWGEPVSDAEFVEVTTRLGTPPPAAWLEYLRRDRWLRSGWLSTGHYIALEAPIEAWNRMLEWEDSLAAHPGMFRLGSDGSRNIYCVDLRNPDGGVLVTDITASGWEDADRTGLSVEEFVQAVEDGSFDPYPADPPGGSPDS